MCQKNIFRSFTHFTDISVYFHNNQNKTGILFWQNFFCCPFTSSIQNRTSCKVVPGEKYWKRTKSRLEMSTRKYSCIFVDIVFSMSLLHMAFGIYIYMYNVKTPIFVGWHRILFFVVAFTVTYCHGSPWIRIYTHIYHRYAFGKM